MVNFFRKNIYFTLIIFISFVPIYSLFSPTFPYTQDGWTHVIRGVEYYKALSEGIFPVRWAGNLNYGYGMPLYIFVFQVPYILYSLLLAIGFSLTDALRTIFILSYVLSGIFMFFFLSSYLKNFNAAFIGTLLYQFFPYRFTDMLLRGSIGEMLVFTFAPLIFLGIVLIDKNNFYKGFFLITAGTTLVSLSHLATGAVFLVLSGVFLLTTALSVKKILKVLVSYVLGFMISSYYLLPALLEHKYTFGDLFAKDLYKENMPSLGQLFSLNILNQNPDMLGDVPVSIGIVSIFLLVTLTISIFRIKNINKDKRKLIVSLFVICWLSIFIMSPLSTFLWEKVTIIRQFQFPWRFLAPLGFTLSIFGAVLVTQLKLEKKIIVVLTFVIILSTFFYWHPKLGYKKINENYYRNYPMTTTYFGETDVIWSAGPANSFPKTRVEVIGGDGKIADFQKNNNLQRFSVVANKNLQIVSRTVYFPGWTVKVDGKKTPIQFQDPNQRGLLVFDVPKGEHKVEITFEESKVRLIANIISILGLIALLPVAFITKRFK